MATVGFNSVRIAVLDANEKSLPSKTYTIDKTAGGAIEGAVTGLAAAQNVVYASNVPFYVSSKGAGDVKLALTVADLEGLPAGALDDILGRTQDPATKISTVGQDTEAPYCAVELITQDKDGNDLYVGLLKGKFSFDGDDPKSTDNNGAVLSSDVLNGSFVSRSDGKVYAKGREVDGVTQTVFENYIFPAATTIPVTGVVLTPSTADIAASGTQQLTATISPSNASNTSVTYASSDTSIATVDNSGLVTGVVAGSATITVTTADGGYTDICDVTVS